MYLRTRISFPVTRNSPPPCRTLFPKSKVSEIDTLGGRVSGRDGMGCGHTSYGPSIFDLCVSSVGPVVVSSVGGPILGNPQGQIWVVGRFRSENQRPVDVR